MAALLQGVQYGLSSQRNLNEENDLIFVKLTDSACRALEEYQRNKSKSSDRPTIQFLGNEGRISIPGGGEAASGVRFSFGLDSADMEGMQGSFECLHHAGTAVRSLGAMHCKIRIHAKEDIYEATRHRMAVVEENHKRNCTQEIKPGGPGIGKKVKVKNGVTSRSVVGRGAAVARPYSRSSPGSVSNSFAPAALARNGVVGNFVPASSDRPKATSLSGAGLKAGNPDIMRRPIKERLIHLLALRPYKKPELYDRIIKEGVKDREKNNMTNILKVVAFMRDNTFHLVRHVWNEVQEEWPFYTEQEKQILKRRKPQNLTPPGSSDCGSSGSGQSPTSTHPGSPPPPVAGGGAGGKRPGYFDGADGLPTKRQRVSHYRKPPAVEEREAPFRRTDRDASNMNPRSREEQVKPRSEQNGRSNYSSEQNSRNVFASENNRNNFASEQNNRNSFASEQNSRNVFASDQSNRNAFSSEQHNRNAFANEQPNRNVFGNEPNRNNHSNGTYSSEQNGRSTFSGTEHESRNDLAGRSTLQNGRSTTPSMEPHPRSESAGQRENRTGYADYGEREDEENVSVAVPAASKDAPRRADAVLGPASGRGQGGHHDNRNGRPRPPPPASPPPSSPPLQRPVTPALPLPEYPDYMLLYPDICDTDERTRYKADFNADYAEYRELHAVVERVSRRFAELDVQLQQEVKDSPGYKNVKDQIVREYQENKQDRAHQEAKRRFQYLHEKLSHIKQLVNKYDAARY